MLELQSAAGSVFEEAQKWEGQVLANGNFRLRRYLGGSDHSAVFLTDIGVGQIRPPAIKLIAADPAGADLQLARWKAAAKLSHPNLLQIFDSGRCRLNGEDLLFVMTENAEETLAEILRERPLSPEEAGQMLKPVLEALSYLHNNGCSLGHMSPSNIMAIGDQVKLATDAVCRIGAPADCRLPNAECRRSKPYQPPEAAREGFTPAADIWALGMIIAEALTQRVPKWNGAPHDEPALSASLPEPFAEIVRHCLTRDPSRRCTIPEIKSHLKRPAVVPVLKQPSMSNGERKPAISVDRAKHWFDAGKQWLYERKQWLGAGKRWLYAGRQWFFAGNQRFYAIPGLAMLAAIILLATLLGHRSRPTARAAGAPDVTAAATSASKPSALKQSRHREASRTALRTTTSETSPALADGIVHRAVPTVPEKALHTIHGRVRVNVKVTVDGSGNVAGAQFASAGPSRYFANLALQAARDWKFSQGNAGQSWLVQFVFQNTGVTVGEREL